MTRLRTYAIDFRSSLRHCRVDIQMADPFADYCERSLWRAWLADELQPTGLIRSVFDLRAAPEAYLLFGESEDPLIILTTNPGGVAEHQRRKVVLEGKHLLQPSMTYADAAKALGEFYRASLDKISSAAQRRIRACFALAKLIAQRRGTRSSLAITRVEACPFHSERLNKRRALAAIREKGVLAEYQEQLRTFLKDKSVLILCAAGTRVSLQPNTAWSEWTNHLADIAGLVRSRSVHKPILHKQDKVTCATWMVRTNGASKALVMMMGGNHLPGNGGLSELASTICAS
jgi:hypothetical protein